MRRKSERNKAKASPEKKVEKPTRKSTRRRGKRSPSTSPERDNSNDAAALSTKQNDGESTATQTRLQGRECEKIDELPENKVSSSETTPKPTAQPQPQQQQQQPQTPPHPQQQQQPDEEDDAGSVWKVARADASPGEIQKLKLCRQRNMSETSDASSSRKRTNKNWQDCGEGVAEEIDSADERSSVPSKTAADSVETTDEIVSAPPGRDSSEEVSDSKEFPPEIATVEMSDDKPNVDDDRQGETIESPICTAVERVDESVTIKTEPSGTLTTTNDGDTCEDQIPNEDATSTVPTIVETSVETIVEMKVETIVETKVEDKEDEGNDKSQEVKEPTATVPTVAEAIPSKEASSDDDDDNKKGIGNKPTRKGSDSSEDNSDVGRKEKTARIPLPRTTSRRKHRDKYRDSSNSDSGESEDDNEREDNRGGKVDKENRETREDTKVVEETKEVKETPKTPETRPETPVENDTPPVDMVNDSKIENDKPKSEDTSERHDKVVSVAASVVQSQTNSKPAKVNLKRSFSTRISVDTVEPKKDVTDNHAEDIVNQDKENQASIEQVDPKSIPKKRRWGTILSSTDATPAFSVSTDSLKVLVPGAKPLSINEVRLSKDDDEDRERRNRDKRYTTSEAGGGDLKTREDGEKPKNSEAKKDAKGDNHMASRRKISIVKDTAHTKSPSPPAAVPTSILLIKNLVRPFTLNQIRELLSRTGTIVDNGFWMDRIKSKCFVEYSNEDQAFETRQALHGISWPLSNPKRLQVEYATKDDMALARELSKDQPISRKTEPLAPNDGWQQDWARDERTNSATKVTVVREWDLGKEDGQHFVKDKEREKKEHDKKRRLRSRSPTLEAHLPAPARKFKKKEDDPPPAKLLDDLFRKTKATPCIYWLPLTNEQIVVKEEMRRQHMAEHARRLEEMRRAERNRDGRRRRSPRK